MKQRKDGYWEDTVPRPGQSPKHFYGKTKAEVKKKIAEWDQRSDLSMSMNAALDKWLAVKEDEVEYRTMQGYQSPVNRIREAFGSRSLTSIQPAQIQAFINSLAKQGYKRATVQRPLDVLRMVFDYVITLPGSAISTNPCAAVRVPSGLEQERRELASPEDIQRIIDGVNLPFGLFAFFLLYTGCRKAEALALTDKDIHDGRVFISKAISWQPNKPIIKAPKTQSSVRSVILLDPLAEVLPRFHGYLFSADGGKSPLTQREFELRWRGYCKAAGLCDTEEEKKTGANGHIYTRTIYKPRIVPHQLRHEFATLCFDAGLDPLDTQNLMGHASIDTTNAIYTHIRESRRVSSEEKLNALVSTKK